MVSLNHTRQSNNTIITFLLLFILSLFCTSVQCETKEFSLVINYLYSSPDGIRRPTVHINGQFPGVYILTNR